MPQTDKIVILGAGPAGLTAGLELVRRGYLNVTIIEAEQQPGGISRTHVHNGNRMDIGGHRFFSKSKEVMDWWAGLMPVQGEGTPPADPQKTNRIILLRNRLSRIFYLRSFFSYPISVSLQTIRNLGIWRMIAIGFSYIQACMFPIRPEKTLEDFIVNRFGRILYGTFFRDYTRKVWGVPCNEIAADWGAQRIKGLSIMRVLAHAFRKLLHPKVGIAQKNVETSLIEQFWYPKLGPGSLWEAAADDFRKLGGTILYGTKVTGLEYTCLENAPIVTGVRVAQKDGEQTLPCTACISSIPLRDLIDFFGAAAPRAVRDCALGLVYRDFMTVGVLARQLRANGQPTNLKDNWIYIQEPDVHVGRLQLFNNWSPWLAADPDKAWVGMEYFATEGDALWSMEDDAFQKMAVHELETLGFVRAQDVEDTVLLRVPKAYPAYFGTYGDIHVVQKWLDSIHNLYPVGRNGMHRYNNMDHSMLSALRTVESILADGHDKSAVWAVNAESEYHESK